MHDQTHGVGGPYGGPHHGSDASQEGDEMGTRWGCFHSSGDEAAGSPSSWFCLGLELSPGQTAKLRQNLGPL